MSRSATPRFHATVANDAEASRTAHTLAKGEQALPLKITREHRGRYRFG
ncbi:MAG: hypothetical protein KJN97_08385 [Deltaproteobacteria bacterium]|nr:hypothetical protein [Deltaproteobacteria bacterium]